MASIGSQLAPRVALERTVSAIASARRAVLAERYATGSFAVEWRRLGELGAIEHEWRDLGRRALEPNVFYEPDFALAAAPVFGRDVGAILVWSGTRPRKLLGFFPARIETRRYGLKLPVLVGWTHPYGPFGTPLVEREAAEPVIAAWLGHLAADPSLPGLLLLPLIDEDGPFAATLGAILRRAQIQCADFNRHRRALLAPHGDRSLYIQHAVGGRRRQNLRRYGRRLAEKGAVLFTTAFKVPAVAAGIEDFFAVEASGWKGRAGTAAADHDDIRRFIKAAVTGLAAEEKVSISRMLFDGRPIAVMVTLRSGESAWCWKAAYDEAFARFSPGVLLTVALTEDLLDDLTIARTDSCAEANHPMIDHIWREQLTLCDRLVAVRPEAPFAFIRRLELLRCAAIAAARSIRKRFHR